MQWSCYIDTVVLHTLGCPQKPHIAWFCRRCDRPSCIAAVMVTLVCVFPSCFVVCNSQWYRAQLRQRDFGVHQWISASVSWRGGNSKKMVPEKSWLNGCRATPQKNWFRFPLNTRTRKLERTQHFNVKHKNQITRIIGMPPPCAVLLICYKMPIKWHAEKWPCSYVSLDGVQAAQRKHT